ncbi:hypothetical protein NDU88_005492 [Pleurodeles waltl]|uniref:ribonuclease H n=1 Tax=Pleurodeles waltl TaxID=8319 RepID=A0AAV7W7Z6_PLEWA|nr:hypothetical protein NDU88_005492 [Pleurodeles waltl]
MRIASDNFCRACPTCQASGKTGKQLKAPLLPLPVVGTPFERVGIDIVGPLDPKAALGNRFILVLVDHATCYPEAIPLRTVTAPVVTRALLGIFSRVGFPKDVVSDRGTDFMSAYMKSMWDECGVTYRFTTPYHPQSTGLVERFNKTLKGMISGLTEAMRRKWDVLLPCLLFAYREVPQKGVGFSPFELLYGFPVRGPLSIVEEGWEKAPKTPPQDVVSYMLALRNQTQHFWKQAKSNLEASQEVMKEWYDRKTTLVEFSPGDKVWRGDCYELLEQFSPLFSLTPGLTHLCVHDIDTGDSPPVKNKIYRLSDMVKASIKEEVSKMLTLGVIEKSSSPWASPVVLVPKATVPSAKPELRFCVDYWGLNSVTRTDAHPTPRADELVDSLGAAKFLSTFDLTSGYWQIALTKGAKEKSAFSTPEGHYQFRVMPFGLKNAPATFQRLVNGVLAGKDAYCVAYLDDKAVYSSSWEEHLLHLKEVLKALRQAGLTIKASKCQIG